MRFQPVAREERQKLAQRGQEVQQSRDQRRTLEAKAVDTAARKPGAAFEPAKVTLPRSPIVAKPANQLGRNQAPPQAQRAPRPDLKVQPKPEPSSRPPNVNRSNPQSEPRQPESEKKSTPGRSEAAPRERQVQPESQQRAKDSAVKANEAAQQRNANALEKKAQQESERPASAAAPKAQREPQQNAGGLGKPAQRVSEQSAREKGYPGERGATRLLNNDHQKEGKGRPSPPENRPGP